MRNKETMTSPIANREFDKYFIRDAYDDLPMHHQHRLEEVDIRRPSLPVSILQADKAAQKQHLSAHFSRQRSSSEGNSEVQQNDVANNVNKKSDEQYLHEQHHHQQQQQPNQQQLETKSSSDDGERPHSAPQSRSCSWHKATRPLRSNKRQSLGGEMLMAAQGAGPRRESVPLERVVSERLAHLRQMYEDDCCVVRHFASLAKGGVICRGDSFKKRSGGELSSSDKRTSISSTANSCSSENATSPSCDNRPFKTLVLGDHGVGKTALIQQFMTSEYMGAVETSTDEYSDEKTLSVLLDNKETMIDITEVASDKNFHDLGEAEAYVIVFSVADRDSFDYAVSLLDDLELEHGITGNQPAVILVGNKSDIVRSRQVTEDEVHEVCCRYRCKMIDLSASLNHRVDELLVGIVSQVRLRQERRNNNALQPQQDSVQAAGNNNKGNWRSAAKGLVQRLLRRQSLRAWSPNNLQTL